MEPIQITKATEKDIPTIRNIAMAAWPVAYCRILSAAQIEYMLGYWYSEVELQRQIDNHVQFYLAYHAEQAIGFTGFGPYENDYKLFKIYVHPNAKGTGAGKKLLQQAIDDSKNAGAQRLILNVHRSNPSRTFYEKNGFHIYETIDIPFGPGFVLNDYLMEKML